MAAGRYSQAKVLPIAVARSFAPVNVVPSSSPIAGPSPLLQATLPLCAASLLGHSQLCRLRVSTSIGTTGSHVPPTARIAFPPPLCRTPTDSKQAPSGFDAVDTLSKLH